MKALYLAIVLTSSMSLAGCMAEGVEEHSGQVSGDSRFGASEFTYTPENTEYADEEGGEGLSGQQEVSLDGGLDSGAEGPSETDPTDDGAGTDVDTPDNRAPAGGAALLSPGTVAEGELLTCDASGAYDLDGDEITWTYSWFVSGEEVPGEYQSTLSSQHFDKGDEVWCVAVPHDPTSAGPSVTSKNNALVINTVPSVQAAQLTPSETTSTGTFTCAFTGWYDPDPADSPQFEYAWELENGSVIAGQVGATLSASFVQPGQSVRCIVTPYDDESTGEPAVSPLGTVVFDGPSCDSVNQQFNLSAVEVPPSILMVVDRSGSMYDSWGVTKSAVGQVLSDLGPDAETGLILYPSGASCSIADEPQVPLGANQAGAIVSAMNSAGTGGSTPMGRAMKSARVYLEDHGLANTTVVLAADGKPSDTCLEDCTGCNCTDESICLWCADLIQCTYNEVRNEVEALHELGVKTFVIGYEGGFGATDFLESLAISGGTATMGDSPFYDAADGSALSSALTDIAESIKQCEVPVTIPGYYENITVQVGGLVVANDATDGYQLSADGVLTLNGTSCTSALDSSVTVQFDCGE